MSTETVTIPAAVLRWLCVNIMATQRAVQRANLVSERRLQMEIDNAEWEYDAEAERQKEARRVEAEEMRKEGDLRLESNPFLTQMREFEGLDKPTLGADRLKNIDQYLKTVEKS